MTWYSFFKALLGFLVRIPARVEVEGREHLPSAGPFILVANHQSVLDPILVQSAVPRNDIYTLTKSTQFDGALFRWVLPRANAVPVRRYRVDPQAVRVMLRHLEAGRGVGIYPEGERTWDGSIQPLRRGSIRVILKAGVPVVPCGVAGTFGVWPRWSRRVRGGPVRIRFGPPMKFGRHDDRNEREALLEETAAAIRRALAELSGAPPGGGVADPDPVSEGGFDLASSRPRGAGDSGVSGRPSKGEDA